MKVFSMSKGLSALMQAIASQQGEDGETKATSKATPETLARLKELCASINNKQEFKVGDFVRQKSGLDNKKGPRFGGASIVTRLLEQPVFNAKEESGNPYFGEQLDMVIGELSEDGILLEFHVDSRRFEPAVF
jgi:hypothetical protein